MIRIVGPSDAELNLIFEHLANQFGEGVEHILDATAAGAATVIKRQYDRKVYGSALGAFGRPKDAGRRMTLAVQIEKEPDSTTVFTVSPHAGHVETGTGIYATVGRKGYITPKGSKWLAFPVWSLPPGYKGGFIPKEKAKGKLEPGAIGLALVRRVKGMQPRPIWGAPETLAAIRKILDREVELAEIFK